MVNDASALRGNWSYPTSIRFGVGRIAELPDACKQLGFKHPLLVTDPGLAKLPMIQEAIARNEAAGIPTGLFADIKSNPVSKNVEDGLKVFREGGYDGIIAFGGISLAASLASTRAAMTVPDWRPSIGDAGDPDGLTAAAPGAAALDWQIAIATGLVLAADEGGGRKTTLETVAAED